MTEATNETISARAPLPDARPPAPPEGFEVMELHDPFEAHMGPLYTAKERPADKRVCAFRADDRHVDAAGKVHEGMMMTFADAIHGGVAWATAGQKPCVTLSMQTSYTRPVREGDLVIGEAWATRRTRTVIFVRGDFFVDGKLVCQATSLWKVLGAK